MVTSFMEIRCDEFIARGTELGLRTNATVMRGKNSPLFELGRVLVATLASLNIFPVNGQPATDVPL
jgi:hypothetical protein